MTLCMAAKCEHEDTRLIVATADRKAETGWAGGDVAMKFGWAALNPSWPALLAGEVSKARDLLATFRATLESATFTPSNIFDKLNEASAAHKRKLCERLTQSKLGISFERFLTQGEDELTAEVRNRTLFQITELEFGCSLILAGFIGDTQYLFTVDGDGEIVEHQNFACIGTGMVIAESSLYSRGQQEVSSLEETLYNLHEAGKLAEIAPGVGYTRYVSVFGKPNEKGLIDAKLVGNEYRKLLQKSFEKFGQKTVGTLAPWKPEYFGGLS